MTGYPVLDLLLAFGAVIGVGSIMVGINDATEWLFDRIGDNK